jgi:hypothetical protein
MDVKAWKNFIHQKERSIGGGYRAIDDRREYNEYVRSLRGGIGKYQIANVTPHNIITNIRTFDNEEDFVTAFDTTLKDEDKYEVDIGDRMIISEDRGNTWANEGGEIWEVTVEDPLRLGRQLQGGAGEQLGTYNAGTKTIKITRTVNDVGKEIQENEFYEENGQWRDFNGFKVEVDTVINAKPAASVAAPVAAAKPAAPGALFEGYYPFTVVTHGGSWYLITKIATDKRSAYGVWLDDGVVLNDTETTRSFATYTFGGTNEFELPYIEGSPFTKEFGGKTYYLDINNPSLKIGGQSIQGKSYDKVQETFANASSGKIENGDSPVFITSPPTVGAKQPTAASDDRKIQARKVAPVKPAMTNESRRQISIANLKERMGQTTASSSAGKKPPASSKTRAGLATIQARLNANKKKAAGNSAIVKAKKASPARVLSAREKELATLQRRMGQSSTKQPESSLEKIRRRQLGLGFEKIERPQQVLLEKLQQILLARARKKQPDEFIIVLDAEQASSINLQKVRLTRKVDYEFKKGVKKSGYKVPGKTRYVSFSSVCSDAREKGKNSFMVKSASGEIRHYIVVGNKCVRQLHDGIHVKFSSKTKYTTVVSRITKFNKAVDEDHQITEFQRVNKQGDNVHYVRQNGRFRIKEQ